MRLVAIATMCLPACAFAANACGAVAFEPTTMADAGAGATPPGATDASDATAADPDVDAEVSCDPADPYHWAGDLYKGDNISSAFVSYDERTLLFGRALIWCYSSDQSFLGAARRDVVGGPFVEDGSILPSQYEADAAAPANRYFAVMSPDELAMVFAGGGEGPGFTAYWTTRAAKTDVWAPARPLQGKWSGNLAFVGGALWDGSPSGFRRAVVVDGVITEHVEVPGPTSSKGNVTISDDELRAAYGTAAADPATQPPLMWLTTRSSIDEAFGAPLRLRRLEPPAAGELHALAGISRDGCRIYVLRTKYVTGGGCGDWTGTLSVAQSCLCHAPATDAGR